MAYAVIGAQGQLGQDLCRIWGECARPVGRSQIDLARPETITPALAEIKPQAVVNCAAFNFVDKAEHEPEAAFAVNALAVHHLAKACRELDVPFVHFSTDYVYGRDLLRNSPYSETDLPGPPCVYGASKLAGEYLALIYPKTFVVRTCGLYGFAGLTSAKGNFVEMILKQLGQDKPMRVVYDQRCTPTFTHDLAESIAPLIQSERYGLYHLTSAGDCTWLEFAQAILDHRGDKRTITPVRTEEFGSPAKRPGYGVLSCEKYRSLGLPGLRPWRDALTDYLNRRPA